MAQNVQSVLGHHLLHGMPTAPTEAHRQLPIYTRTIILWAFNMHIDTTALWANVEIQPPQGRSRRGSVASRQEPRVVMLTTCNGQRGMVKRSHRRQRSPFRSVLSVDVEYGMVMPNLKISRHHTIQATGCHDMQAIGRLMQYLATKYNGRGFHILKPGSPAGFVGDVVLANVHFHIGWSIDRHRLRDIMNSNNNSRGFVAIYEPMLGDVSVTIKYTDGEQAAVANSGYVYPMWCLGQTWSLVPYGEVNRLAPQARVKTAPRCHTFRVFATGSVVQVGRWPCTMQQVHDLFCRFIHQYRRTLGRDMGSLMIQPQLGTYWPCPTKEEQDEEAEV